MVVEGPAHYKWAGDDVQCGQAHAWVRKELLKTLPCKCTKCGNCAETQFDFGGACSWAGEIGNHYCDKWSKRV